MTLEEIVTAVKERGFEHLEPSLIERWANEVIRRICDHKPWPFVFATKEGKMPLKVEDLAHVASVVDVTNDNPIRYVTLNQILRGDPDLSGEGNAEYWYTEDSETIKVYPANTSATFKARYRKTPAKLTKGSEEPIVPSDYHDVIVDGVVAKAYRMSDNFEAMRMTREDYREGLAGMEHALLRPNYDRQRRITRTGTVVDYR